LTNRPARLNRTLLALTGLVLIAAGAFGLATHFRLLRLVDSASPLVPGTMEPPTSALYIIAAVAIISALLALRWLLAQFRIRSSMKTWHYDTAHGQTRLRAADAVAPLGEEVRGYPYVLQSRATLIGPRDNPALDLIITTEHNADLGEIRERLTTESLPRLRHALGLNDLPVTIEFRIADHTIPRKPQHVANGHGR
jgi:hypothetical protein